MATKRERSAGVVAVYKKSGTRLFCLVRHAGKHWGFPKGHVDEGETDEQAALRELREETGIADVEILQDVTFSETYAFERGGVKHEKENAYFLGFASRMDEQTEEAFKREITDVRWLPYEEARMSITFDESRAVLEQARRYLESRI